MADVDFVNSLYRNVLARDPDANDANAWVSWINEGASYDQVTSAFVSSIEVQTFVNPVIRLYEGLLNRAPDAAGLHAWANVLRGGASLTNIVDGFLHSSEAGANGFGYNVNNATFINNLYLSMGRTQAQVNADVAGVNFWRSVLDNGAMSRATVAQSFLESAENQQNLSGFVTGWSVLRASGNPGPTTAQLKAFSSTATTAEVIDSAYAVGVTAALPTGPGAGVTKFVLTADAAAITESSDFDERLLTYTLTLDHAPTEAVTINYHTLTTGTATAGEEFTPAAGTVEFGVGQTVATVQVIVYGDMTFESDETVNVMFSGSGLVAPVTASGLIRPSDWYVLRDTGANLAALPIAVLNGAQNIGATDGAVTLTGAQVTDSIVAKFYSDEITLRAPGETLSGLSWGTLSDTDVVAVDATDDGTVIINSPGLQISDEIFAKFDESDQLTLRGSSYSLMSALDNTNVDHIDITENAVTLSGAYVTDAIVAKFNPSDDLTLSASGATLSALSVTTLSDPDVVRISPIDTGSITLTGAQVTDTIVGKFVGSNFTLNAPAATLLTLSDSTLAKATNLNASDNTVTLTGAQVSALAYKFDASDTLIASGAAFSGLPFFPSPSARGTLNASDNAITLTASQFNALDSSGGSIDGSDTVTINLGISSSFSSSLNLNGAGGGALVVVFDQISNSFNPTSISNFAPTTDTLQFSKLAFTSPSLALGTIAANQLLSAAEVTAAGATGYSTDHRFLYDTDSGNLFYDADGNSGFNSAVQIATLTDHPVLTPSDFVMIA